MGYLIRCKDYAAGNSPGRPPESIFPTRSKSNSSVTDSSYTLFSTYRMQRSTTRIRPNQGPNHGKRARSMALVLVRSTFFFIIISSFMNRTDQQVLYHSHLRPDYSILRAVSSNSAKLQLTQNPVAIKAELRNFGLLDDKKNNELWFGFQSQ
jgi:hypothetical protein